MHAQLHESRTRNNLLSFFFLAKAHMKSFLRKFRFNERAALILFRIHAATALDRTNWTNWFIVCENRFSSSLTSKRVVYLVFVCCAVR